MPNSGFSLWGNVFRTYGVRTETLTVAPTQANLRRANIYVIVDPDTKQETDQPNFIQREHVRAITDWVKSGGVLVLMANDVGNTELDHFNELAMEFGIQFNKDSKNRVQGNEYATGGLTVQAPHQIFRTARNLFLKEVSTLQVGPSARAVVQAGDDKIMAVSRLGRGIVFVVGDPWLYNEYTDSRRLPPEYDNYKAAVDLTLWLISQSR